jgi:protein-S-isoprenylcysteine O-methyltransferase Ste14
VKEATALNHVRAVLLLPFMNTVVIPTTLLIVFRDARFAIPSSPGDILLAGAALVLLGAGLTLVVRAISLFVRFGHGTLAPWDPTRVLITDDIYRFSRNPMKAGLFLILLGETALLRSPSLAVWALVFITVNAIYIRVSEEPGLKSRFGSNYDEYCAHVPRWLKLIPGGRA